MSNETLTIRIENRVRLQQAASVLRDVLPGDGYGMSAERLQTITRPLAEAIQRLLETPDEPDSAPIVVIDGCPFDASLIRMNQLYIAGEEQLARLNEILDVRRGPVPMQVRDRQMRVVFSVLANGKGPSGPWVTLEYHPR